MREVDMEISDENRLRIEVYLKNLPVKSGFELIKFLIGNQRDEFEGLLSEISNRPPHQLKELVIHVLNMVTEDIDNASRYEGKLLTIKQLIDRIASTLDPHQIG
jgi:hypothetical protein